MSCASTAPPSSGRLFYPRGGELREFRPGITQVAVVQNCTDNAVSSSMNRADFQAWDGYFQVTTGFSELRRVDVRRPKEPEVVEMLSHRFGKLVMAWKQASGAMSSITAMVAVPQYQEIIGIGKAVVPLILAQLEREGDQPDMWFPALKAITHENPVSPGDQGDMVAMAKAWIEWGQVNSVS